MEIRQIKEDEIKDILPQMLDLFSKWEKVDKYDRLDLDYFNSLEHIGNLKKLKNHFFVAVENNKIIAFMDTEIKERPKIYQIKKEGHINLLYVTENRRNKGVGIKLIEQVLDLFKKENIKFITVNTHALDNEANEFWKKRSFRKYNIQYARED